MMAESVIVLAAWIATIVIVVYAGSIVDWDAPRKKDGPAPLVTYERCTTIAERHSSDC